MKKKILSMTIILAAAMAAGCGKIEEPEAVAVQEPKEDEVSSDTESEKPEETAPVQDFSFADVADREFYFSSGAGAWYTVLYIHEDGTFDGHYQDSDMGDNAPEYPNGTVYYSDFSGSFTEPEKIDDTTYVFQIDSIEYPLGFGEKIKDGYYYDYGTAYGLDGAEDLYMYLPGAEIARLPEAYRNWVGYYNLEGISETELPFYGLYNEREENGFSSYEINPSPAESGSSDTGTKDTEPEQKSQNVEAKAAESEQKPQNKTAKTEAEQEIQNAEAKAAELEQKLQNAPSQADLNVISGEIFAVWDDALNAIWGILKENLDAESMKKLTEEERTWIAEKEAAVKEAGAEVEGGSMYAMVINGKAAKLTKERVYELAEYLQ